MTAFDQPGEQGSPLWHALRELARVQAERDKLQELLTDACNLGERCVLCLVRLTGEPVLDDRFASIRKEAGL